LFNSQLSRYLLGQGNHFNRKLDSFELSNMKRFFAIIPLLIFGSVSAQTVCVKCDIEKVSSANSHLDRLTFQIVSDFLCTFDATCKVNIEFVEWSNEILYKVLEKEPSIFLDVIDKEQVNNKILLEEIESPIHDFNYQKIYDNIKAVKTASMLKKEYMNAVINAASKSNIKIKK
jgi:hypothetical protein